MAAVPSFLLGSLPHWLYAVPRGRAWPPVGGLIPWTDVLTHLRWAADRSWPTLAGFPPDLGSRAPWLVGLVGAVYLGLVLTGVLAVRRAGPAAPAVALACLLLGATNVGLAVGTPYGRFLEGDPRYLLPLYTALPPLLGLGLARLPRVAAAALAAGLLCLQGTGAVAGDLQVLTPGGAGPARGFYRAQLDTVAALERAGLRRLYTADVGARVFTFLSRERVVFSEHYREILPRYALAVDGADAVAWWAPGPWPAFEQNLRALGVEAVYQSLPPLGGAYTRFTLRAVEPLREVDPRRLRVTAGEAAQRAVWTVDRDLGTLWHTAAPKRGGEWLEVDLGAVEPVVLLRLLPGTYQEVPTGLRLEASVDGVRWTRLVEVPEYLGPLYWSAGRPMARVRGGRVELRVPPTPARYLRLTQLGQDARWRWTVRELFVYVQAPGAAPPPPDVDGDALVAAVRAAGVRRLYADHGWGSRVALREPSVQVLPANLALDPYGFTGRARAFWPRVRWAPGSGVLLEPADAEAFERLVRAHGWGFTRAPAAGLVLFAYAPPVARPGVALPRGAIRVTASRKAADAARAVDGDPATRWGTGGPQAPGDWVRIDLDRPRVVRAVRLWTAHPTDAPRDLRLEGSEDGVRWRALTAEVSVEGRVRWGGMTALRDGVEAVRLDFAPARLSALRLTLTRGDPVFDWSIHELTVYGPA